MPTIRVLLATVTIALAVGFATDDARSTSSCVTPSRSDRPAATAGRSIRMLYAYPADGVDRSAERAAAMTDDLGAITSWWRSQDPAREPRFDVWESPCGATPDIGVLRLPYTAAELEPIAGRASRITDAVQNASDGSPFVKYLVYYDGPADSAVCGQGNGEADGTATAVVFLGTCTAVPNSLVAAHELLHALGGAPLVGPPNECPSSPQHVCDSPADILYPLAPRRPLSTTILDVGHDDYYGHSGSWFDLQDSRWLRLVDRQVSVTVAVAGRGSVVSSIPGITCASECTTSWDQGTFVVLEARPAPGQRLVDWGGVCARPGGVRLRRERRDHGAGQVRSRPGRARAQRARSRRDLGSAGGPCAGVCRRTVASFASVTLTGGRHEPGGASRAGRAAAAGRPRLHREDGNARDGAGRLRSNASNASARRRAVSASRPPRSRSSSRAARRRCPSARLRHRDRGSSRG